MSEYKQCPNGHYYQGDHCPYCSSSNAPEKQILDRVLKACHNLHAYDEELNKCPICGSSTVVDKFTSKNTDTALAISIHLTNPVHVKVGELELFECNYIQVALPHCYKHGYFFTATQNYWNDEALEIEPDKKIVFGTITMTGKEFIRLCDLIYDNKLSVKNYSTIDVSPDDLIQLQELLKRVTRVPMKTPNADALEYGHNVFNNPTISDDGKPVFSVKVCPNGHGYDANQMACPFCGSDIVSEVIEERCGFTLVIADLSYEKDGVPILCQHAEVDGEMLSGDLCLRIEYTGSFKYAYYIAHKQKGTSGGLIINPQSHIVLSGDGFSDTFTGCEFYKMCDELFEKKESINQGGQDDTLINKKVGNTCCEPELQKDILVEPKKSLDFKQCSNGHYYQGDTCPFCKPEKKVISIGSVVDNDYIVANPLVSEHHCRIEKVGDDRYRIYDLGSANGTFVNGSRVEGSCPLNPFDQVLVGNMVVPWMHHFASDHIRKDSILRGVVNEIPGSIGPVEDLPRKIGPVEDLPRKQTGRLVPYPDTMNPMRVEFTLYEGRNTIGRNTYCNITINDNRASSTHAVILFRAGKHSITDQYSAHGTFVNGKDINLEPFYLNEGDVITIGNTLLQFHSIPSDPNK